MKFEVSIPLGFAVRTSEEYWQRLIIKHPDTEELEELMQSVAAPDEIPRSSRDAEVLLFHRVRREERLVVAVARRSNGDGFLITAY